MICLLSMYGRIYCISRTDVCRRYHALDAVSLLCILNKTLFSPSLDYAGPYRARSEIEMPVHPSIRGSWPIRIVKQKLSQLWWSFLVCPVGDLSLGVSAALLAWGGSDQIFQRQKIHTGGDWWIDVGPPCVSCVGLLSREVTHSLTQSRSATNVASKEYGWCCCSLCRLKRTLFIRTEACNFVE